MESAGRRKWRYALVALFSGSFVAVAGGYAWASYVLGGIAQPLIIRFSASGIEGRGDAGNLALFALSASVAVVFNALIALEFEKKDRYTGRFIAIMTFALSLLILMGFWAIIRVNSVGLS